MAIIRVLTILIKNEYRQSKLPIQWQRYQKVDTRIFKRDSNVYLMGAGRFAQRGVLFLSHFHNLTI